MKKFAYILLLTLCLSSVHANNGSKSAKELGLYAGTKATIQWERIFSSERRMKKYGIDKLSQDKRDLLKSYLIEHAADSKQPIVPGL